MTQQRRSEMSAQQARDYTRFEASLDAVRPPLPEPVRVFLLAMREHQLRADLSARELAQRAAALERKRHGGRLPPGRKAWVGHGQDGKFSAQRLSAELKGQEGLPRQVLVEAIAEAYAPLSGEHPADVGSQLEGLRLAAVKASAARRAADQERAMQAGGRTPTYTDIKELREERDRLHGRLDQVDRQLGELQARHDETLEDARERAQAAGRLEQRVAELTERSTTLRGELAERDQQLATARGEQQALRAERDQVRGLLARVEQQLGELQARYGELVAENHERTATIRGLEQRAEELAVRSDALRSELAARDRELVTSRGEHQSVRAERDQLEARVQELVEHATALQSDHVARGRALAQSQERNAELEKRALWLRHELDQRAGEIERLRRQLAQGSRVRQDPRPDSSGPPLNSNNAHPGNDQSDYYGHHRGYDTRPPPPAGDHADAGAGPSPRTHTWRRTQAPEPSEPLVVGADDRAVNSLIADLVLHRFRPAVLGGWSGRRYGLQRDVALHVCAAAFSAGLLLPTRRGRWVPGRDSTSVAEFWVAGGFLLTVVGFFVGAALLHRKMIEDPTPSAWLAPALIQLSAMLVTCIRRTRRVLLAPLVTVLLLDSVGLSIACSHPGTNGDDELFAILFMVTTVCTSIGLWWARRLERCYDEIVHFRATERHGPSPALRRQVELAARDKQRQPAANPTPLTEPRTPRQPV